MSEQTNADATGQEEQQPSPQVQSEATQEEPPRPEWEALDNEGRLKWLVDHMIASETDPEYSDMKSWCQEMGLSGITYLKFSQLVMQPRQLARIQKNLSSAGIAAVQSAENGPKNGNGNGGNGGSRRPKTLAGSKAVEVDRQDQLAAVTGEPTKKQRVYGKVGKGESHAHLEAIISAAKMRYFVNHKKHPEDAGTTCGIHLYVFGPLVGLTGKFDEGFVLRIKDIGSVSGDVSEKNGVGIYLEGPLDNIKGRVSALAGKTDGILEPMDLSSFGDIEEVEKLQAHGLDLLHQAAEVELAQSYEVAKPIYDEAFAALDAVYEEAKQYMVHLDNVRICNFGNTDPKMQGRLREECQRVHDEITPKTNEWRLSQGLEPWSLTATPFVLERYPNGQIKNAKAVFEDLDCRTVQERVPLKLFVEPESEPDKKFWYRQFQERGLLHHSVVEEKDKQGSRLYLVPSQGERELVFETVLPKAAPLTPAELELCSKCGIYAWTPCTDGKDVVLLPDPEQHKGLDSLEAVRAFIADPANQTFVHEEDPESGGVLGTIGRLIGG